jgi:general secretion pathway protein K
VVEDCVNAVGVDLNTASAPLLARVAGMTKTLAQNIVEYRDENGRFESRSELKKVPRLGPKAFEQCAGFMRIAGGKNPLDASGVHPEAYPVVEKILQATAQSIQDLMGNAGVVRQLDAKQFIDEQFGLPTVQDIFKELEKPGRDPRGEFKTAVFAEGVEEITDLKPGMILEGTVTNVTNFGAFVDIGVHQDGLVHISSLSDKFVEDPHQVVKTGDIVKVKVLEVDVPRKRIALTMRLDESAVKNDSKSDRTLSAKPRSNAPRQERNPRGNSAMGNAFADALKNWKK